jgi:hypothetical protein
MANTILQSLRDDLTSEIAYLRTASNKASDMIIDLRSNVTHVTKKTHNTTNLLGDLQLTHDTHLSMLERPPMPQPNDMDNSVGKPPGNTTTGGPAVH